MRSRPPGILSDRALSALAADAGNVTFYSNQLAQVAEAEAFRNTLLKGFQGKVHGDLRRPPTPSSTTASRPRQGRARARIDLLGALHGNFSTLEDKNILLDLSDLVKEFSSGKTAIRKDFMTLGKLGTNKQYYIPWMQATYVCVANKKVLPLLPKGANINRLTYGQYNQWAKAIKARYGPRTGFPAGSNGLIHRFFQGYSVPAFSGGVVTTFKQPLAAASWRWLNAIWDNVHPQSLTYGFMQDPLLSEEVLLAWEHVARLRSALLTRPDAFVVFPAPIGPKGLAYMPVLAGLAIPKNGPEPGRREGADPAPAQRQHAGEDAVGGRVLSRRRGSPVEADLAWPAGAVERDQDHAELAEGAAGAAADRARRRGRQLQHGLPRHVHEDRDQEREHPERAERAGRRSCRRSWTRPARRAGSPTRRATGLAR